MAGTIYFCGGEDLDFQSIGGQYTTSSISSGGGTFIDTTAGHFRAGYARYALTPCNTQFTNTNYLLSPSLSNGSGGLTTFWYSARVYVNVSGGSAPSGTTNPLVWVFRDVNAVSRIRMRNTTSGSLTETGPFAIEKVTAAGVVTQLGSNTTSGFTHNPAAPDKLDVFVNYGTSGTITVYINGNQVFTFSGDTTTDGNTTLDQLWVGMVTQNNQSSNNGNLNSWSEIIVASRDTRAMSLVTQVATANGNTHTFTSGAASNVNGNQYNDASPDYSTTASQIQEYEVTPAMPTGNFGVISMVQHMRATIGSSGPAHIQFMVHVGGSDFNSSSVAPTIAFSLFSNNWNTNPSTTNPWATTDFANASNSFNLGYESIT